MAGAQLSDRHVDGVADRAAQATSSKRGRHDLSSLLRKVAHRRRERHRDGGKMQTMAEFELYCFGESGNSYKAALMLTLCGLDWAPHKVAFMDGETRGEAFRSEVNEMGECPTLAHRGRLLSQSGAILDYLVQRTGRFGWSNDDERREVLRWLLFDNHKFTS
jgi:hypothetical protein